MLVYAWSDVLKWYQIFSLFDHMLSTNPAFASLETILTLLLLGGILGLMAISQKINGLVHKLETL